MERYTLTTVDVDVDSESRVNSDRATVSIINPTSDSTLLAATSSSNSKPNVHISLKLLHLPSPLSFRRGVIRSRSPSNASILSALTTSTSAYSSVSTHAPSTPYLSPTEASSFNAVLAVLASWATLPARSILALSVSSKSSRAKLCTSETFKTHLSKNGWDTAALERRIEVLERDGHIHKGRRWLHLARSAVQKEKISELYCTLPEERLVKGKKLTVKRTEYTKEQERVIDGLLRTLVDCATEHDENNFNTLARIVSFQCNHTFFIHFLSTIPSYNWKSCFQKTFIVAAFINQQHHAELFDEHVDHLASSIDFWREGPQKAAKSLSLNNTRSALLYAKGLTAFLHPRPNFNASKHFSRDYDSASGELEKFPGLEKAIARFAGLQLPEQAGFRLNLEGTYWKTHQEDCPRSVMHFSISAPPSLSLKRRRSLSLSSISRSTDIKFQATVHDETHEAWVMQGSLDRLTGRGRMVGSSGVVMYEVWVVPWGMVGHKVRLGKEGTGNGESLGDFVLVWGKEMHYGEENVG